MVVSRKLADVVGLQAVAWLAGQDDLLGVFLGATGASEQDFRSALEDPAFQGAVLDFILMDDAWVSRFCDAQDLPYDTPRAARAHLPGGEEVHWT
ncbi:hypothetical protein AL036_11045 [Salipiger aestuarii]|uniref:Uncharacterized protein DUF3572 n=1 Tax=Salipiger aestuarii TaxID=568098 RepID=A0A327YBB5_9RHOB|nr:DUF3572 domain-containing protein [Salipiger aestuarii]EIE52704.1 hypothetical protein C357_02364 [Citreicella sp. 357]KAA8607418.1 hypothetical protein AL036_11045 [Salipiger aestuarii]KAA8612096.1 hypothetical protein AL037_08345 [Salipiger aestuarii]KAB2541729.1 hypothetical protein AL035_10540 [Salipiger aestuarii]RAK17276.1 uncharacterized protein DUF3572 [Salipiger aestuarii]